MIRLGILGAGNIAHRFMKGIETVGEFSVECVYARNSEKAKKFAETFSIAHATSDIQQFLYKENLAAVYIATPNFLHFENVMQALRAGLHVMVEKPAFIDPQEAEKAYLYAKEHGLILMEAMKVCYLPTTQTAKQWIDEGKIGEVISMEATFCRRSEIKADHPIFDYQKGGGALFDVGCYALAMVRELLGEPLDVQAVFHQCASGVDDTAQLMLTYADQRFAVVHASFLIDKENAAMIYGSEGTIKILEFWKSNQLELNRYDGTHECLSFIQPSEFTAQIKAFASMIKGEINNNESISGLINCRIIREGIEHGYYKNKN